MVDHDSDQSLRSPSGRFFLVFGLVLLAIVGLLIWQVGYSGAGSTPLAEGSSPAPDFRLVSLNGETYRLADFRGQVVVLELWATWCGPCRMQAEILHEVYSEVDRSQVEFLAVSLGESRETVASFVEKDPFTYPVLLDPEEALGVAFEVFALPTVVVVDPEGLIRFAQPGITDAGTLRSVLSQLGVELRT